MGANTERKFIAGDLNFGEGSGVHLDILIFNFNTEMLSGYNLIRTDAGVVHER